MKINKIRIFLATLILLPLTIWADEARLTDIHVSNAGHSARMTLSLTQTAPYHIFSLENPHRMVVDFKETRLAMSLKKIQWNHSAIRSIRSGHPQANTLRLVFDLYYPIRFKVLREGNQVFIDIDGDKEKAVATTAMAIDKAIAAETTLVFQPKKPVTITAPAAKPFVIVIDPGHGGKDTGAIGNDGAQEKHVVLAIAKKLATLINQQSNMRAVLTRDGDYFVPLRGRLELARKGKADLFIAIHADSYFNDQASGASVYALSHRGATSEAARWLAKRENTSELGGVDLAELGDKSYVLRSVLIDLAQTATTTDSLRLGTSMLNALDDVTKLHYARVEQAPFVVLKSPDIPSILVETGFISNPSEEEKLRSPAYQEKIARALFDGVRGYMRKYVS